MPQEFFKSKIKHVFAVVLAVVLLAAGVKGFGGFLREAVLSRIPVLASEEPTGTEFFTDYPPDEADVMEYNPLNEYRTRYDIGCSRQLEGDVEVFCFFVDDNKSSWSKREASDFAKNQIEPALKFIEGSAESRNIELALELKCFYKGAADFSLKYDGIVNKNLREGGSSKDIFNQMAINMGYTSDRALVADYSSHTSNDRIYIMLLNKKGTSYARNWMCEEVAPYHHSDKAEHAVIFAYDLDASFKMNLPESRSVTVAHEILHLFGAEDYYSPDSRMRLADKYCYYDIMALNTRNLYEIKITDATAFSLGWNDDIPELFQRKGWNE